MDQKSKVPIFDKSSSSENNGTMQKFSKMFQVDFIKRYHEQKSKSFWNQMSCQQEQQRKTAS